MKRLFWKSNKTEKKVFEIINKIQSFFGNKVDNFKVIGKIYSKPDSFEVEFEAYKYFIIYFCYECGFGFCVKSGEYYISILNSQSDYNSITFEKVLGNLKQELELRIPDKFLIKNGWK